MIRGTVKWYDAQLGYGFLRAADGSGDVFVSHNQLAKFGIEPLLPGQPVRFEAMPHPKGLRAVALAIVRPA